MTPEDLAEKHPCLYHVTDPNNWEGIKTRGLLSTSRLLTLFDVEAAGRVAIERQRRPNSVPLSHPVLGEVVITDNEPLSEAKLRPYLDDGLTPEQWLVMLNERVFFWVKEDDVEGLLNARRNRGRSKLVLVLDTLSLARCHGVQMELSPINSGATQRRPARRGLSTFTPLFQDDYFTWRRKRGQLDSIKEITVVGGIEDVADHVVVHYST